jgi:hypothetical protein
MKWAARVEQVFALLADAERNSVLPPEPRNANELEEALISLRSDA